MALKRSPSPIGQRLQRVREMAELHGRELDRLAETTQGHAGLIESGVVQNVSADTIAKFARVLGTTTDWLITGDGKQPSERAVRAAVDAARSGRPKRNTAA